MVSLYPLAMRGYLQHDVANVVDGEAVEQVHEDDGDEKGKEDVDDVAHPVVDGLVKVAQVPKGQVKSLQT
jgi:hypothetical protein